MNVEDVPPPLQARLVTAQQWTRARVDEGVRCPCCHQFAKVYRRKIHRTIAKALIEMRRIELATGEEWVHVASAISPACELGKARYWMLVEEEDGRRLDGGRPGWWRLTDLGREFVHNRAAVTKYARIYDGRCIGLTGPPVRIRDCLPVGFDLQALLAGQ